MNQDSAPVGHLIKAVELGDASAEQTLWNEFFHRLLAYVEARVRRRGVPMGLVDEEAVTVSVLESLFKCAKEGRLQSVQDTTELSQLLYAMTNRKFVDHWRRATRQKSFPGAPLSDLSNQSLELSTAEIPETAVMFEDELSRLIDLLPDELHRQIAVLKLAGYTLDEIGDKVNRAVPTVNRKWRNIRRIWADELQRPD